MPGSQLQIWPGLISRIACLPSKRAIVRIILAVFSLFHRLTFHGRVRSPCLCSLLIPIPGRENFSTPAKSHRVQVDLGVGEFLEVVENGTFYSLQEFLSNKRPCSNDNNFEQSFADVILRFFLRKIFIRATQADIAITRISQSVDGI